MSQEANVVPELPPSPLQHSVDLYALPEVEHLISVPAQESNPILDVSPLPQQLSIRLYPLSEIPVYADGSVETLERPPSPTNTSIELHPLPAIDHLLSVDVQSEATGETHIAREPLPLQHSVELFSAMGSPQQQEGTQSDTLPPSHDVSSVIHGDSEMSTTPQATTSANADSGESSGAQAGPSTLAQTHTVDEPVSAAPKKGRRSARLRQESERPA